MKSNFPQLFIELINFSELKRHVNVTMVTSWYIFIVGLLNLIVKTHLTSHQNSHEYISTNGRYFDDFTFIEREISGLSTGDGKKFHIKFDPSSLDFRQRPLGVPHIRKVQLFNFDTNRSIDMTSISGSTVHFHSSFFKDKKIPPMGNTSFNVVFLGREEGYIESCLSIHTNNGHFKYNVKGVSVHSPYFLRPIVDVILPLNATFAPLIYLHNPHLEPIQIKEIYTSGGDFHLELPSGEAEGPRKLWEIAPYETKAVIRVKFTPKIEQNYMAFIRIRLNITEEILVVPLEIDVGPKNGVFSPQGYLEFGLGASMDAPKTISLCLMNSYTKPVKIQSVSSVSKAIHIEFNNNRVLPPKTSECFNIANLTLDWKKASKREDYHGTIEIKYRNSKIYTIPYFLTVLEGGLVYDAQVTKYFNNDENKTKNLRREFMLKNELKTPVSILNCTLSGVDALKYFTIEHFKPLMLKTQENRSIFTLNIKPSVKLSSINVRNSFVIIETNVSTLNVPILTYKGTLKLFLPFKSKDYSLDVGLISFNTRKEVHFLLYNENPVSVRIKKIETSVPLTTTTVVGCGKNDPKNALLHHSFEHLQRACNIIRPNEYAVLKLTVQTVNNEGHVWGETSIETDYEHLSIPVQFKVAAGKLEIGPDRLVFDQCFPGKICSHPLRIHSTFNEPMIIKNIMSLPPDSRLSCKHNGHILAHTTKIVGHLYLNPNVKCGNECYTGLHQDSQYENWMKTMSLPKNTPSIDLDLFNTLYNRFLNTTSNGLKKWQNLTLRIDTSEVKNHIFKTRVKMSWPSLITENTENNRTISFQLTQTTNAIFRNLTIKNPSDKNLLVQVVLEQFYPNFDTLCEGLPSVILPKKTERSYNFEMVGSSTPFMLKPGENRSVSFRFSSETPGNFATLLIVRNNLTVLELLRLQARSSEASFRFGNRKPGANQPLLFEFTEKHFRSCENAATSLNSIKRSFTARNIGELPIEIKRFLVNNEQGEGYGFKINCNTPFILHPNATKKIEIEFTPDFTLSKITRLLIIETSCNFNVNYTLQATIPAYYINACGKNIIRPFWEFYLSFTAIVVMSMALLLVMIISVIDAEKIKKNDVGYLSQPDSPIVHPVLDLRLLGQQIKEEVQNNRFEKKSNGEVLIALEQQHKTSHNSNGASVLIPTVGKSKRKLIKKNENYTELTEENAKKNSCKKTNNAQVKEKKITTPTISVKKKEIIDEPSVEYTVPNIQSVEEEIKENTNIRCVKKKDDKTERKRIKTLVKPKEIEGKKTECKRKKEQKDKVTSTSVLTTRKVLEKQNSGSKNEQLQLNTNLNRITPARSLENRATFSDVVSSPRNETVPNPTVCAVSKPTMYVEPYKQQALGPIGSKPIDFWHNDMCRIQQQQNIQKIENVNSYFSNYEPSTTPSALLQQHPTNSCDIQSNSEWLMKKHQLQQHQQQMHCEAKSRNNQNNNRVIHDYNNILDPWNRNLNNSNTYWSTGNHSVLGNAPTSSHNHNSLNGQNNYLWGSSSVWQPWSPLPETTNPVNASTTRIPPGFNNIQRQNVENEGSPTSMENYNPFTSNNLWDQDSENIWRYLKDP